MKVQNIIDGGGQRAQAGLHMLDPVAALGAEFRVRQQSGKQLQTAQRVADFVGQHGGHFRQRLFAAQSGLGFLEPLAVAHVAQDKH